MNFFFPWQVNEDGTGLETLNHVGRHELARYFDSSHDGLPEFIPRRTAAPPTSSCNCSEDPLRPGYFYATTAPEFGTHAAGRIIGLDAPEDLNADDFAGGLHHLAAQRRHRRRRPDSARRPPGPLPQPAAVVRRHAGGRAHDLAVRRPRAERPAVVALRLPSRAARIRHARLDTRRAAHSERHQQVDHILGQLIPTRSSATAVRSGSSIRSRCAPDRGRRATAIRCRRSRPTLLREELGDDAAIARLRAFLWRATWRWS